MDTPARRRAGAERAWASARFEGEDVTPEMAELMDRHVAGEPRRLERLVVGASRAYSDDHKTGFLRPLIRVYSGGARHTGRKRWTWVLISPGVRRDSTFDATAKL